jgi:hypothetical protein
MAVGVGCETSAPPPAERRRSLDRQQRLRMS